MLASERMRARNTPGNIWKRVGAWRASEQGTCGLNTKLAATTCVLQSHPFLMIKPHFERQKGKGKALHPERFEGYVVDLANHISKSLNVKFEIQLVNAGKYGSKDESGNWNGMVNELLTRVSNQGRFQCFISGS